MAESKELPVKNIVNIGLLIAGFLVVRKVLTTLGIVKTAQEQQEEKEAGNLEAGSEKQVTKVDTSKPELALNPNYWRTIMQDYKKRILKGAEIGKDRTNKIFNPNLSNKKTFVENINRAAFDVKNSKGIFNDNEDALYNVFQNMKNQVQISYLADTFQKLNNKDMASYIKGFTNEEERAKIFRIIKNKPLI